MLNLGIKYCKTTFKKLFVEMNDQEFEIFTNKFNENIKNEFEKKHLYIHNFYI